MITSLNISNFKCFDRATFELGALSLFTGFNSGGKSSAIQPLLLLAQGLRSESLFPAKQFPLNGRFVRLGSASDIIPLDSESAEIDVAVSTEFETRAWVLKARAGDRSLHFESSDLSGADGDGDGSVIRSLRTLSFIGTTRLGPIDDYPMPDVDSRAHRDVGFDGRYAPFVYHRFADDLVRPERFLPGAIGETVRKQVDNWMSWLFPGAQANVQFYSQLGVLGLQFRVSEFGEWRRPANVGYGFSYVFPIIVSLLTAKKGQLVVIDSPEAHLHPSAQSKMGWLLGLFACAGVQLIVESHSDHVLNGIRLAVRQHIATNDLIKVTFFAGPSPLSPFRARVIPLTVDSAGSMSRWPEGFFDQMENDLARL